MDVNCEGCGKCCYSEIPDAYYTDKAFLEGEETKTQVRSNRVYLTHAEVKKFWDAGLGNALDFGLVAEEGRETSFFVTIKNLPKMIDSKWYLACPMFDPVNKKCRIHNTTIYPSACKNYPFDLLVQSIPPLCDRSRLIGLMSKEQIENMKKENKISNALRRKEFCVKESIDMFKERFQNQKDKAELLLAFLYQLFGMPKGMCDEDKQYLEGAMKKVMEEARFADENFNKT